jgi:hypothetical protein
MHVPDVLVFRNGYIPTLFQIKESEEYLTNNVNIINKRCFKFASESTWNYEVIFPKKMLSQVLINNINMLIGFTKERSYYDSWIKEIMLRHKYFQPKTIEELATSFAPKINPYMIIPIIYHLITIGIH